jgi:hypothetical protein
MRLEWAKNGRVLSTGNSIPCLNKCELRVEANGMQPGEDGNLLTVFRDSDQPATQRHESLRHDASSGAL